MTEGEQCLFSGHRSALCLNRIPRGSSCKDKFKIVFRELSFKANESDLELDPMVGSYEAGDEHFISTEKKRF
jgi:hypothetical protein